MLAQTPSCSALADLGALHHTFLLLLPRIERHARTSFSFISCPAQRDDCVAEVVALAWAWFLRLVRRGKQAALFALPLARFACCHVRAGRTLCRRGRTGDRGAPTKTPLQSSGTDPHDDSSGEEWDEAMRHNTRSGVLDQVVFRLDFARWLGGQNARDRQVIAALLRGEKTGDVARQHGLSAGRISQLRRHFQDDWRLFQSGSSNRRETLAIRATP